MRFKLLGLFAALAMLAACESTPDTSANQGGAANLNTAPSTATTAGVRPGSQQDLEASAGNKVYFNTDRSEITAEGRQILQRQAEWLKRYPNVTVTLEGHCDERGTREYNLALGERRATAAKNVLVALGIPANRVSTISYGKERPAVVGSNEQSWAQNRRAVTVVN